MKLTLLKLILLLSLGNLLDLLGAAPAQASDFLGGELTYEHLAIPAQPHRYRVRLRLLRDCSGASFNQTETVSCRVGSLQTACASTDPRNLTVQLSRTGTMIGQPYCIINPVPTANQCDPNAPFNYEMAFFDGVVTLPPALEWVLSWEACCRPALGNLQGADTQPLRLEATLRNLVQLPARTETIFNHSPQYLDQDVPVQTVCRDTRTILSFSAFEPDGDSLVYELTPPLVGCSQPATYQTYAAGTPVVLSTNPPCVAVLPPAGGTYSAQFPLPSFQLSGVCPVRTGTPYFSFNPATSSFNFYASLYHPETTPADRRRNQYAVAGRVTEYRRILGRYYEVGSTTRNMLVAIIDCQQYQFPNHASRIDPQMLVNGQLRPLSDTVRVTPGQTARVVVTGSDPDGRHQLRFTTPGSLGPGPFPSGAYVVNSTAPNRLELTFTPPATTPEGPYVALIRAEDNNCPVRGVFDTRVAFKVTRSVLSAAQAAAPVLTTASPNPFTDVVSFRVSGLKGAARLDITNVLGQVVAQLPLPAGPDGAAATWRPAAALPAGVYLARVAGSGPTLRLLRR